jgi:ubiquinone/menaquinone biosynthesis C-methylase UbiE
MSIKYNANYYKKRSEKLMPGRKEVISKVFADVPKGASVLDIGCGIGDNHRILTDLGYNVLGLDYDDEMLRNARKKNTEGLFQKKDFSKIKMQSESQYDVVFAQAFVNMFSKQEYTDVLQRMFNISKYKVYLSTKIYKKSSETELPLKPKTPQVDPKQLIGIPPEDPEQRYISKYTRSEFCQIINNVLMHINKTSTEWKWTAEIWDTKDPFGKVWIHFDFTRLLLKDMFKHKGIVTMNQFFTLLDIEMYINEIDSVKDKPDSETYKKIYDTKSTTTTSKKSTQELERMVNLVCHSDVLSPLVSEKMHNLASWFMECPVLYAQDITYFIYPHRKETLPLQMMKEFKQFSSRQITIGISLDKFDGSGGGLSFVEEIQKYNVNNVNNVNNDTINNDPHDHVITNYDMDMLKWKSMPLERGDVVVFSGNTPFKFEKNDNYSKKMIFITFVEMTNNLRHHSTFSFAEEVFKNCV